MKEHTENPEATASDSSVDGAAPAPKKCVEVTSTAKAKPADKKPVANQKAPAKAKLASKADDDSNDGGVVALSGFLYQILGFTGLKASAELGQDEKDHESLEVLVRLVREADQIIHEPPGQDMAIEKMRLDGLTGVALIQFKFSRLAKQIPPKEFGEIATRMAAAKAHAERAGKVVEKCFLVGNRPLSPGAKDLKKKPNSTPVGTTLSQPEKDVLSKLEVVAEFPLDEWRAAIVQFGAAHGLTEVEVRERIPLLVGYVMERTVNQNKCTLDLPTLAGKLCGQPGSRPLGRKALQPEILRALDKTADAQAGKLVRRTVLHDAQTRHADRALLVFVGCGGTGKTATMHWWADQLAREDAGRLVDFTNAQAVQRDWMKTLLERWSNRPWADGNDAILQRLMVANPGAEAPLLHLSLDGLDEVGDNGYAADKIFPIIDWFRDLDRRRFNTGEPPPARLVVSCRSKENFLGRWLLANLSGHGPAPSDPPPLVFFGPFDDDEFRELLRLGAPSFSRRILANLAPSGGIVRPAVDALGLGDDPADLRAVDSEVAKALKDPSMWRAFYCLDDQLKAKALDGDPPTKRLLGEKFVDRFCTKAALRLELNQKNVRAALVAIARAHLAELDKFHAPNAWVGPASQSALMAFNADRLLDEARSGGLVNEDNEKWQWRNRLIGSYLAWQEGAPS